MAGKHLAPPVPKRPARHFALGAAATVAVLSVPGVGFAASHATGPDGSAHDAAAASTGGTTGGGTGVYPPTGPTTGGGGSPTTGGGGSPTTGGGGSPTTGAVSTPTTGVHFTGGAGGPTNLPHTGLSFGDQVAYGAALIFGGAGTLLLAPRRRVRRGKTLLMPLVPLSAALAPTPA